MENVHGVDGACCLPCSCDTKTCKEDGNYCLSKIFDDNPGFDLHQPDAFIGLNDAINASDDNEAIEIKSECIKAIRISYIDKDALETAYELSIPSYFMITRCFLNNMTESIDNKCENPSEDEIENTLPVTSL